MTRRIVGLLLCVLGGACAAFADVAARTVPGPGALALLLGILGGLLAGSTLSRVRYP